MRISKNFSLHEFTDSPTAKARGINNDITPNAKKAVFALVEKVLQPFRTVTGWALNVNSGYRSAELNRAVGGVETSQHRTGEAADIAATSAGGRLPVIDMARKVVKLGLPFDQLILYPSFLHISHRVEGSQRGQILYHQTYKGSKL
jgi:hypothetical protein